MAVTRLTQSGWRKFRPVTPGAAIAVVAPASPFDRAQFDAGVRELERLGFRPVFDDTVFERRPLTAGPAEVRAAALMRAFDALDADAVMAVRGGYGSMEVLPYLDADRIRRAGRAFIGYSDLTALHTFLGAGIGVASVHGPMLEGRFGEGPSQYDSSSFLSALSAEPMGEVTCEGLDALASGEAVGPLVGGNLTQLLASFDTPFAFRPPDGHVLFLEDVGERPYRVHRMLTQWRLSGRMASAAALVFGQFPRCEEPGGGVTVLDVVRECTAGFPGPVLFGLAAGHTTTSSISLPLGVRTRVVARPAAGGGPGCPRLVLEEAAAA
jgi:muramoyltetrapeptide carboxypeptidase